MSSFVDGVIGGVKTAFCTFINIGDSGTSFFNELSPLPDIPSAGPFWNRVLCDRNEPIPVPPPPFNGGQCPGVLYRFFATRTRFGPDDNCDEEVTNPQSLALGPVSGPFFREFDVSSPDRIGQEWYLVDGSGNEQSFGVSDRPRTCPASTLTVNNVVREDGQPDNCGDPGPVIPPFPPEGDTVDIDITYVNNEGDTVVELGDLRIFAPVVIAPVNIVAPIRVNLPDVSFDGQIVLAPRFDVVLNPPVSTDGPGVEGGDDEQPEPDGQRELIGVRVITSDPTAGGATTIFGQGAAPNLYVPRLATVQYEVKFEGVTAWTEPVDIKAANQFVPAPKVGLVTRFVVNNIPNVTSVARPIFVPETPCCCE